MKEAAQRKVQLATQQVEAQLAKLFGNPRLVDKVSFVAGIFTMLLLQGVLLAAPDRMGALYTLLLVPLLVARYLVFHRDKVRHGAAAGRGA